MVNQDELADLLARCALRDKNAFKRLFDSSASIVNAIVFKMVKNQAMSDDILQEAYWQIWQNAGTYRADRAKPLSWMIGIARYRALDRLAKENRYVGMDEQLEPDVWKSDKENPESHFELDQEQQMFQECLQALSSPIQQAIQMAYQQGFSRDELASVFEININTLKSWLKRGVETLKQCIESKVSQR